MFDTVRENFFNAAIAARYLPDILKGMAVTLQLGGLIVATGIGLGLALAFLRAFQVRALSLAIVAFADVLRALPPLVVLILLYFALPFAGAQLSGFAAAWLALALALAAFAEEIFWAGITSVPKGQWEAGRSTGLSFNQTLVYVVLPQAIRLGIPPLTNRAIGISKGTTLGSVIAVPELLNVTSSIQSNVANPTALTVGAILFLALFLPFVRFTRWLERAYGHPRH